MLKILEISDLHTEFHGDGGVGFLKSLKPFSKETDVLVVAGDLTTYKNLEHNIYYLCDVWENVVYVAGNHEYYHSSFNSVHDILKKLEVSNKNFHWLNNSHVEIKNQRFVGCTLWFEENNESKDAYNKRCLNDFNLIQDFENQVYHKYDESVRFLQSNIKQGDVVVTHHLPTFKSVSKRFSKNSLNVYFANNLDDLILETKPNLWFHGHTHDSFDYKIGVTRIICNPLGYLIDDIKRGNLYNNNFKLNNLVEV